IIADSYAQIRFRYEFEVFEDQSVQRTRAFGREMPTERTIDVADERRPVDEIRAVRLQMDFRHVRGEVGREFADDLFEDVLQRDAPLNVAVFADDEREPTSLFLKIEELRVQRRALRYEIRLAGQLQ